MGLPYGEEIVIVGRTMWTQSTSVTDRRTDGRTDRRTDRITITNTVQRIASHGKNGIMLSCEHLPIMLYCMGNNIRSLRELGKNEFARN